jgi:transposase
MPIEWETYQKVRYMFCQEKKSIRAIARELSMSRKTVKKYCQGGKLPDNQKIPERTSLLKEKSKTMILKILEENKQLPRKYRRNARDIWEHLMKEGISASPSTIRKFVHDLKNENPDVFIPLDHEMGESMQFDWGDMNAVICNEKQVISLFCVALPYSGAIHRFCYKNKSIISFLDGHIQTFTHFNGVPRRCTYDNLKTAVLKGSGQNAVKQNDFMRLESHYGFKSEFCNIASGWEKSSVENAVAIIRRIAFTPMPYVESFKSLQEHVTNKCLEYNKTHTINGREESIDQMLQKELKELMPLPLVPLDPGNSSMVLVHPDSTIVNEGTRYSVPHTFVGKYVTLVLSPFHIKIFYQGNKIWTHNRAPRKYQHQYILEHYLEILERKPRSINQAKPISKGIMPSECSDFLKRCKTHDSKYQLIKIMLLGKEFSQDRLLWAIQQANNTHNPSIELVKFFLNIEKEVCIKDIIEVFHKDLEQYDSLIPEGENL